MESQSNKNLILEPLNLNNPNENEVKKTSEVQCLFCDVSHVFPDGKDLYLKHLFVDHRFVIADVNDLADLKEYLIFWRKEFNPPAETAQKTCEALIPEYCSTLLLKQLPDGTVTNTDEKYYLISDILPKDKKIREDIKKQVIENALKIYQFERTDENFKRECLYCRSYPGPTRIKYLEHLYEKHFLHLGKPENLVFIDELIDVIQNKLTSLICVWCERTFKDRPTLKEHMRKKGHKRINPENKSYDKFYIVNYKLDKQETASQQPRYQQPQRFTQKPRNPPNTRETSEEPTLFNQENDSDWSDWNEEKEQDIICLFCSHKETKFDSLKSHMLEVHEFNYDSLFQQLNFYQKVKLVNFVRRKIHLKECFKCDASFEELEKLFEHMKSENHQELGLSDEKLWDKPEFYFPTFEDDNLLCYLEENISEDSDILDSDHMEDLVISEDKNFTINRDAELLSRENFKL